MKVTRTVTSYHVKVSTIEDGAVLTLSEFDKLKVEKRKIQSMFPDKQIIIETTPIVRKYEMSLEKFIENAEKVD